ncbi:MAG: ATP-binding protein [Patescibacteria group bacterium]|nr:ATP-binding protein [Patescibacteria group bacterium]
MITVHKDVLIDNPYGTTASYRTEAGQNGNTQNFTVKMDGGTSDSPTTFTLAQAVSNYVNFYARLEIAAYTNISYTSATQANTTFGGSAVGSSLVIDNGATAVLTTSLISSYNSFTNNGTFIPGSYSITNNGSFTNGATGSVQPTDGTWNQTGNFSDSGIFNASGGTVVMNGSTQSLTASGTTTFYNLTFFEEGNSTIVNNFTVGNNLTFSKTTSGGTSNSIKCPANNCLVTVHGDLTVNQTSGTTGSHQTTVGDSGGTQNFTIIMDGGTQPTPAVLTHTQTGTNYALLYAKLQISGYVRLSQSIVTAANGSLGYNNSGSTLVINNGGTLQLGTVATSKYYSFTINGTIVTAGYSPTINNTFANNGIIKVNGNETLTFTKDSDSGTVEYIGDGGSTSYASLNYGNTYYNLKINSTSGNNSFTAAAATVVNNSYELDAGTFVAPLAANLTVNTDFNHTGGIFTHNSGTVILASSATANISGDTTFNNFTSTIAGKRLNFEANKTQIILGTTTLQGTSGSKLVLRSSSQGTRWLISPQGTRAISNVDVQDSNNITMNMIYPTTSINAGNNLYWFDPIIISSSGAHGSISPSGTVYLLNGDNQTFDMIPDANYHVADVLVDGDSVGAVSSYTFTNVIEDHTISVSFAIDTRTISVVTHGNGQVSPAGPVTLDYGSNQTFDITPSLNNHIADVQVGLEGDPLISVGPVSSYIFSNVLANSVIEVTFALDTRTISASAGSGGSISPNGEVTVNYGDDQPFAISPSSGYHTVDVLVDSLSQGSVDSYTFTDVQTDHTISATFAIDTFTLTPSAGVNGSISPQVAQTVDYGSAKTFTFTPNTGYHIDDVLIDGVSQGNLTSYTFSDIQANHIISVSFAINTYSLSANAGSGGTINPSGTKVVNYNASQTYAISANPGYKINKVEVDGISVGTISSHTFTNINADHTISATFVADVPVNTNHTIFVSSVTQKPEDDTGNDGYVTPNGNVTVEDGKNQTFQIVAGENTRIVDVLVDGTSLGSIDTYTFANVQANHTIKAVFIRQFTVTIKVIGDNHGSIAPIEPQTLDYNDNYTFSIIPDSNYRISEILVNQEPFLNNNCVFDGEKAKCTIKKIATEYKIKVKYEKIKSETKKEKNETFIETIVTNITKPFSAIFLGTSAGLSGVGKVYSVVSDKVVEVVKQTPPPVAYSFPYLLFILLGLMILVFLYQTKKEVSQTRKIIKLTELDKNISDQKENFLMLSAHYIRTPLTIISSGTELFLSLEKLPKTIIDTIKDALTNLKTKVDVIFNDINNNSYLKEIKDTDIKEKRIRTYLSPYLWLPIILIAGIAVFSNYLFATVAKININIINYICEALVFAIAAQVLFIYFRKRQIEKANRLKFEAILAKQQVIDSARNTFMKDTAKNLKTELATLVATTETIKNKKYLKDAEKGMDDLKALIEKFEFLSKLEAGKLSLSASTTNLSNLTKDLMKSNQEKLAAKNLAVNLPKDDLSINTDKDKLAFILGNVLDNAIKFNKDQGSINLTWTKENDLTKIKVEDTGVGISKEGQELLFKPFSRGTSTLQFDYEGMGTNLYIAKLVANYLDGDISVESKLGKGTKTTIMIGNNQPINETSQKPDDIKESIINPRYKNKKAPAMMKRLEKQK